MTTRAYAKINLDLRLGPRRPDGYHPIDTFFVRVNVFDTLHADITTDGKCTLSIDGDSRLSAGEDNLIIRAARAVQKYAPKGAGVALRLDKKIPQGAGLGGGSSDAASTLLLMRKLWSTHHSDEDLALLGAELGSDVPFFLQPHAAHATGRGEILEPVPLRDLPWALLIHPGFPSPTAQAYAEYAKRPGPGQEGPPLLLIQRDGSKLTLRPRNDLERPVEGKFLWIRSAREWLEKQSGVMTARMSGSGSTVFAIWRSENEAKKIASAAREYFGGEAWLQVAQLICGSE
jgi:4-diphosphocytidyl-2-C-methyl-D-erythritol kinase